MANFFEGLSNSYHFLLDFARQNPWLVGAVAGFYGLILLVGIAGYFFDLEPNAKRIDDPIEDIAGAIERRFGQVGVALWVLVLSSPWPIAGYLISPALVMKVLLNSSLIVLIGTACLLLLSPEVRQGLGTKDFLIFLILFPALVILIPALLLSVGLVARGITWPFFALLTSDTFGLFDQ